MTAPLRGPLEQVRRDGVAGYAERTQERGEHLGRLDGLIWTVAAQVHVQDAVGKTPWPVAAQA